MKITIAQLQVGRDLVKNKERILHVLSSAHAHDWVIFPEGMLFGYFPEDAGFLESLDAARIEAGIRQIQQIVTDRQCTCLLGSVVLAEDRWHNAVIALNSSGQQHRYHKIELSALDRQHFSPGRGVVAYEIDGTCFGIQACRELLFPQPWMDLKRAGSKIIFHINNAIQKHDDLWKHLLIGRAIEQGIFVCSVNNAAPPQTLASYLIDPSGRVILETDPQRDQTLSAEIDLGQSILDLSKRTDY